MNSFIFLSTSGDPVEIEVNAGITCQSAWLQAALDIGEKEGIVPVASTETLHCLVAYMKEYAAHVEEWNNDGKPPMEVQIPISCTCKISDAGQGYDVHQMLMPSDIIFLDNYFGKSDSWEPESQKRLFELLAAADFVGQTHLRDACAVYFSCRLMSASESDILGWFAKGTNGVFLSDKKCGEEGLVLSDEDRLNLLKETQKNIYLDTL
ncbi:uncharacterized protein TM35_000051370 [Trypanosoma theileri]|uniref:SKP1 component POZ domain-containing protein n=1 Tax=Trypanosoma theileri TaxID=67003 RepID=A0A1X0P3W5_9TRYP|nr:uncharacterized protein TM35_000051370 [Trypanosoma theileri]ORC91541.1 hypothetical protein TM35_000051370 [Trypanosoma theileri]